MQVNKIILALGLTLVLGLFASCGGKESPAPKPNPQNPQSGIVIKDGVLTAYPEKEIKDGTVSLPSVKEIAPKVFEGYKTLKKVEAPALAKIGASAFKGSSLTSLTLGATVPDAVYDAFSGTPEDKSLNVPADKVEAYKDFALKHGFRSINGTVLSAGKEIKDGVLTSYPSSLTPSDGIVRLDGVKEIAAGVFAGNTRIKEVHIPGVKKVGAGAFKGCSSLMKVDFGAEQHPPFAINETDPSIGTAEDAFWGTPEDKVLVFNPKNNPNYLVYLEYIARHHFARLDGIEIPETLEASKYEVKGGTLTRIKDNNALVGLGRNGVLILPSSIKKIGDGVFSGRFQNFKVIYGEGVEEIGNNAFSECGSLTFAHFPKLKKVGELVFERNGALSALNFPALETIGALAFNSSGAVNPIRITYLSLPKVKKIGRGVLEGRYEKPITLLFGAKPEVDMTPYNDDMPQDGSVTFHGMISPVLYVSPADKARYNLMGDKWLGFTVKELK